MNHVSLRILLLFLAGFLVRAALVVLLRDATVMPSGLKTADDVEFNTLARNLARGEGFRDADGRLTSFRAPGYPFFVAGIYRLFGERAEWVYLVQCLLGGWGCVLAWAVGRELLDERGGWLAGWLTMFYLPYAWFATMFISENLFTPLLAASAWMMVRWRRSGLLLFALGGGVLLGASVVTRPFAILLAPLWGVWLLWSQREKPVAAVAALTCLGVGVTGLVLPWTWRNQQVHGQFVFMTTNGGSTFYGGNNPRVIKEWRLWGSWVSTVDLPGRAEIEAAPTEVMHDRVEWRLGKEWIRAYPLKALATVPLKLARLLVWLPDFDGGSRWMTPARAVGWLPFLVLLLAGIYLLVRNSVFRTSDWMAIHLVMIATVITAVIFWGSPRFRDANGPLLLLYPALALWSRQRSLTPERGTD